MFRVLSLLTLGITLLIPLSKVSAASIEDTSIPHVLGGQANPRNSRLPVADYKFKLHSHEHSISEITIEIPEGITSIRDIKITDANRSDVSSKTNFFNKKAIITFTQPITPNSELTIELHSVRIISNSSRTWLFPVTIRSENNQEAFPIGIAQIRTY